MPGSKMKETIACDIDGILTIETSGVSYAKRTPDKENIKWLNCMKIARNARIVLWTSRRESDRTTTERWLKANGVMYDKLVLGKMRYTHIVDDKMLVPPSRRLAEKQIQNQAEFPWKYAGDK